MTTQATLIRDAVFTRLNRLPGYTKKRKSPAPQWQPEDLPLLSVFIVGETLDPDGDENVGDVRFIADVTVAVSVIRGFDDPIVLQGEIDANVDEIEAILADPTFAHFIGNANTPMPLFESVHGIRRQRLHPQSGETYFEELRLQMIFRHRPSFDPVITDMLETIHVTTTFPLVETTDHTRAGTQQVVVEYDIETE